MRWHLEVPDGGGGVDVSLEELLSFTSMVEHGVG